MPEEQLWRDASGRLTFSTSRVEAKDFSTACQSVAAAFALTPDGPPVRGLDQVFWDFHRGELAVGFDWDVWTGFTVVARTEESEPLVRDIAGWLGMSRWAPA